MKTSQINKIVDTLKKEVQPYRIYLFGSQAVGDASKESDIDILVVTNDDFIPSSYSELSKIRLKISKAIESYRYKTAIDLIVHTKAMNQKFFDNKSAFSKEISQKGILIYEAGK
jgi:predicted nucleotidyltransferase